MGSYRIKAVSRMTGIRQELLRRWEKRYSLFKPQRAGNRYREFDDEDVQLLLYVRQQIEQGRSIGELAAEGREALLRRLAVSTSSQPPERQDTSSLIDELLGYVQHLDKRRLDTRLAECGMFYPFATLLTTVLTPLMHRLGDHWAAGEASIISGHFATVFLKQRLLSMLQAMAPMTEAPILLCACPAEELHELGLLIFAYMMQQEGWQVYYLGPNLPTSALLQGCQRLQPALVALSLTYAAKPSRCLEILHEIDTHIATAYPTLLGGQAIEHYQHLLYPHHLVVCETLTVAQEYGQSVMTKRRQTQAFEHSSSP